MIFSIRGRKLPIDLLYSIHGGVLMGRIKKLIQRFTVEQWEIIDAEYVKPEKNLKCVWSLILVVFLLVIQRYFGQSRTFTSTFGGLVINFSLPEIWSRLYSTFACLILFFVIPYTFIHFVLREKLRDHGFTLKGISRYMPIYLAMILVVLPLVVIASFSKSFSDHYPLYSQAGNSLWGLLIWELSYGLYFLVLEFFFRGFMIFSLSRCLGSFSIFVMVIPYVMIHFGKPVTETIGSIIAGVFLGTLALRTRSIFGGVFIHITIAWSMDIFALLQKGQLQALVRSLI
jgi:hypothetical protein